MRKPIPFIALAALLLASACTLEGPSAADPDALVYRAAFDGETRGVVLHESGDEGHAGMFGTNCPFDTRTGGVTGDYDLPDQDEDVQDGEETELGDITLTATIPETGTVHVLDKTGGAYTHVPLALAGVTEGRLVRDGIVGLTGDCALHWIGFDGTTRATASVEHCAGDVEVDPDRGVAFVADTAGSVLTDGSTTVAAPVSGDLVAFDDVHRHFYVATSGGSSLAAVQADSTVRWSVEVPGRITALDDGGDTGSVAVVLELDDRGNQGGDGGVAFFDGATGERTLFARTPTAADDLAVSGNGRVLALVRPEQTFFYGLAD